VGRVHRPSTLSLPAVSLPVGILLLPVCHVPLLVFSVLMWMLDIDSVSLVSAQANIDRNGLSERIVLLRADTTGPILLPLLRDTASLCVTRRRNCTGDLLWDIDLVSACVTRHFMQARRKLRSPRQRKSSYPTPSVYLFLRFPNNEYIPVRSALAPTLR
jgi:hypothetical protein